MSGTVWDKEVTTALDSILKDGVLTMKVLEVLEDGMLVNLYKKENKLDFNIGKRLYELSLIERWDLEKVKARYA